MITVGILIYINHTDFHKSLFHVNISLSKPNCSNIEEYGGISHLGILWYLIRVGIFATSLFG
jgi:hypothetical protein